MRIFTYFITYDDGPIKIGKAKNVSARLRGLQTGSPFRLYVLGLMIGPECLESSLHTKFAHLRLEGEWFRRAPELTSFIETKTISSEAEFYKNPSLEDDVEEMRALLKSKLENLTAVAEGEAISAVVELLSGTIESFWESMLFDSARLYSAVVELDEKLQKSGQIWNGPDVFFRDVRTAIRQLLDVDWREAERLLSGAKARESWIHEEIRKRSRSFVNDRIRQRCSFSDAWTSEKRKQELVRILGGKKSWEQNRSSKSIPNISQPA